MRGAHAEAAATCTASGPSLTGSSAVPIVTFNGQAIDVTPLEQTLEQLPTGELVKIKFNEQTVSGGALTQRAVHLQVQDPAGKVVKDVVVAEARVAGGSQVCDRAAQEDVATGGDGSGDGSGHGTTPTSRASRAPSTTPRSNLCVITRERDGNLANGRETVTVVGKPLRRPERRPRGAARPRRRSRRRRAPASRARASSSSSSAPRGPTASPAPTAPDVIFGLGGNDRISGGRGNDCIVGGKGADRLVRLAGQGHPDRRQGGDKLNGGSESDKLIGRRRQATPSTPPTARTRSAAARGNDAINVATAGPAAQRPLRQGQGHRPLQHQRAPPREGLRAPLLDPLTSPRRLTHDPCPRAGGTGSGVSPLPRDLSG